MTSEHDQIDLTPLQASLSKPLQLIPASEHREELQTYLDAALPHVERAVFDILSRVVSTLNESSRELEARLEYRAGGLHLAIEPKMDETSDAPFVDSDVERVTLRLPRELKELIDRAAGRSGLSANNWYVRELSHIIGRQMRHLGADEPGPQRRGFYRGRRGRPMGFADSQ